MIRKGCLWLLLVLMIFSAAGAAGEGELLSWADKKEYTYVTFGQYPQWIEGGNPEEDAWTWSRNRFTEETAPEVDPSPILWRVLEAGENSVRLLSEYVLCTHAMHSDQKAYRTIGEHFENTDLAVFLNTEFFSSAFTEAEAKVLLAQEDTGLKVSLASSGDINNKNFGMGTKKTRKAWATEYAIRVTGTFVYQKKGGQHSPYWMKEQAGSAPHAARATKVDGTIGYIGAESDDMGIRPVVELDLSRTVILSGSGTRDDPYVMGPSVEE